MAEKISGYRSWIRKDGFYSITQQYVDEFGQVYDTFNSGFIFKGKWVPWGLDFLEQEKLNISIKQRGILDKDKMGQTRIQSRINMIKDPINTLRSFSSVLLLYIKSLFTKLN